MRRNNNIRRNKNKSTVKNVVKIAPKVRAKVPLRARNFRRNNVMSRARPLRKEIKRNNNNSNPIASNVYYKN